MDSSAATREDVWLAVLAHRERAVRVARSRCASPQDVDDVVQEALLRVAAMPNVDLARVGPLLTTVVANLITDSWRSAATAVRAQERLTRWQTPLPGPDEAVCDELAARWLWSRRDVLSDQDRRVLELRVQGLTPSDVALRLGLSVKGVEGSFTRARSGLRKAWKAAAAFAGGLWCNLTRSSENTAVVALAAVAAVGVVALQPPGWLDPALPGVRPAPAPVALRLVEPAPARSAADAREAHRPAAADERPVRPVPSLESTDAPAASVVAGSGGAQIGQLHSEGAHVERDDMDESFTDTVARCVREGLEVSLHHVECREQPPGIRQSGNGTQYLPPPNRSLSP